MVCLFEGEPVYVYVTLTLLDLGNVLYCIFFDKHLVAFSAEGVVSCAAWICTIELDIRIRYISELVPRVKSLAR